MKIDSPLGSLSPFAPIRNPCRGQGSLVESWYKTGSSASNPMGRGEMLSGEGRLRMIKDDLDEGKDISLGQYLH